MIRCQKCGYSNQATAQKCVKCQTPLLSPGEAANQVAKPLKNGDTQSDIQFNRKPWDEKPELDVKPPVGVVDTHKTMRRFVPNATPCALAPLSIDGQRELTLIPLKGESVILNRDLLDQGNRSISRNGHASLVFKEGAWWIENLTEMKTTFVQVNRPVKLTDGDVVLIGDTLYRFKEQP